MEPRNKQCAYRQLFLSYFALLHSFRALGASISGFMPHYSRFLGPCSDIHSLFVYIIFIYLYIGYHQSRGTARGRFSDYGAAGEDIKKRAYALFFYVLI